VTVQREVSVGVDPVQAGYDINLDRIWFNVDGELYSWWSRDLPFTVCDVSVGGKITRCADRNLVLRFGKLLRTDK
jgi:hypothetical protein